MARSVAVMVRNSGETSRGPWCILTSPSRVPQRGEMSFARFLHTGGRPGRMLPSSNDVLQNGAPALRPQEAARGVGLPGVAETEVP